MSPLVDETGPSRSWAKFLLDLLEPEFAPMLSPTRYIRLLSMDAESLARNARVAIGYLWLVLGRSGSRLSLPGGMLVGSSSTNLRHAARTSASNH